MKTPRQTRPFTIITASIDAGTEGAARRRQHLDDRALTLATGAVTFAYGAVWQCTFSANKMGGSPGSTPTFN